MRVGFFYRVHSVDPNLVDSKLIDWWTLVQRHFQSMTRGSKPLVHAPLLMHWTYSNVFETMPNDNFLSLFIDFKEGKWVISHSRSNLEKNGWGKSNKVPVDWPSRIKSLIMGHGWPIFGTNWDLIDSSRMV